MKLQLIQALIISALLALFLTACNTKDELIIPPTNQAPPAAAPISYLALGDSYTIGQGIAAVDRWPNQLSRQLIDDGYEIGETKIIAQTGWKTNNLLNAIADSTLANYDLVSLLIGVNNQYAGQAFDIFNTEFDSLLTISIGLAGGKENVFVVSIPDYGVTPFGSSNSEAIAEDIDLYNNYMKQQCFDLDILYVDITEISRTLADSPGALATDNLHPSASQYMQWVDAILPGVLGILME